MLHRRVEAVAVLTNVLAKRCDGGPLSASIVSCREVAASAADHVVGLAAAPRTEAALQVAVRDVQALEYAAREMAHEVDERSAHSGLSSDIRRLSETFAVGVEAVRDVDV